MWIASGRKRAISSIIRAFAKHRKADLGIGGQRDGRKTVWRDHVNVMSPGCELPGCGLEGADDAVDLGLPGVGGQDDAHVGQSGSAVFR